MNYWLVKQEPEDYSWSAFVKDGKAAWTGVRSFPGRKNLRAMKEGDWVLYYHSGSGKGIVGLARVTKEAYPDPTATEGDWSAVDLKPVKPLKKAVLLGAIKADSVLRNVALIKQTRLSVMPFSQEEFARVLKLAETPL